MNSKEKPEVSFANLALEPMHGGPLEVVTTAQPRFRADTRGKTARRTVADRRVELRFEPDRRSGKDRRPKASWEPGSNL